MAEEDGYLMREIDRKRLKVISVAANKRIKQWEAGDKLEISERQVRRLVRRYRAEGDKGLIHRLRGCESARKIKEEIRDKIVDIYVEKYKGFGPTLAQEKLAEVEDKQGEFKEVSAGSRVVGDKQEKEEAPSMARAYEISWRNGTNGWKPSRLA